MRPLGFLLRFFLLAALTIPIFVLASCDPPLSIVERIGQFEDSLNKADRTGIHENFHPTETQSYDQLKNGTFVFASTPLDYAKAPFSFSSINDTDTNNVIAHMTNDDGTFDCKFIMIQDDAGWLIHEFHVTESPTMEIKRID